MMKLISIEIEGVSALLTHAIPAGKLELVNDNRATAKGEEGTPREQADKHVYNSLTGGAPIMPGANLYAGLIEAGKFFKEGKRQLTTQKTSLIPGMMWILEDEILIDPPTWEVDSRPIRNQATGHRVICHRPRWDKWRMQFTIQLDTDEATEKLVRKLVDALGRKIGLGAFRPACKGPFGRFVVKSWEVSDAAMS